jgi:hypothetical protein
MTTSTPPAAPSSKLQSRQVVLDRIRGGVPVDNRHQDVREGVAGDQNPTILDQQRRSARTVRTALAVPARRRQAARVSGSCQTSSEPRLLLRAETDFGRIGRVSAIRATRPAQTSPTERAAVERCARRLAWGGNAWHLIEFAIALAAGIAAGSVALIGFGADSLIEVFSGSVIAWRFSSGRGASEDAERKARRLIAISYFVLAVYIVVECLRDLIGGHHPQSSAIGIGLAAVTAVTMPLLARAKRRVGAKLGSGATTAEAEQNQICAYLSIALLVGLLANALFGWWWADPAAALVIAAVAGNEGREAWSGDQPSCC